MIRSLHKSIHPPEMEIDPPKMACGCPCGRVVRTGYTCNPLTIWNVFVSVQLHSPGNPRSVQLGNTTTFAFLAATLSKQKIGLGFKGNMQVIHF